MAESIVLGLIAFFQGMFLLWMPWVSKQIIELKVSVSGIRERVSTHDREIEELQKMFPREVPQP